MSKKPNARLADKPIVHACSESGRACHFASRDFVNTFTSLATILQGRTDISDSPSATRVLRKHLATTSLRKRVSAIKLHSNPRLSV
jgi:hypothetical protein